MSRLSTLALYLTLCTKLVTSQTAAELCAENPYINSQSCIVACTANPYDMDSCHRVCDAAPLYTNNQACCAAGNLEVCSTACDEDYNNHQACCAAGLEGSCQQACEQYGNHYACDAACDEDSGDHLSCCISGGDKLGACCDADGVDDETKKAGCCYKALTDNDPATVCLVTPIDSAELKKQQNSASC